MVGTVEDNAVTAMETKKINANDTKLFIISEIHNRLLTCMASLNLSDLIRVSQRNAALIKLIGWKLPPANPLIQIFLSLLIKVKELFLFVKCMDKLIYQQLLKSATSLTYQIQIKSTTSEGQRNIIQIM